MIPEAIPYLLVCVILIFGICFIQSLKTKIKTKVKNKENIILCEKSGFCLTFSCGPVPGSCGSPAIPSTTRSSLVKVPVLSKQRISTFPANGILK